MTRTETDPADFYVGRGNEAQYLGTRLEGAHPGLLTPGGQLFVPLFQSYRVDEPFDEARFRKTAALLVDTHDWPWGGYHDPADTTWVYAFDKGSVYVYYKGAQMIVLRCNYRQLIRNASGPRAIGRDFPNTQGAYVK